ncbi:hypothetical protein FW774_05850 [Pedobacter sp. BS3]|uniref:hypothetical protein n=1 Tax=Pedobacter sp. BS3 TaxID=2567937 RepID=UPI0011EF4472|nr:hypothetical protein [Pedobacter sp. BS3]TZF84510.1 hypothetical protein FW774_05850 [Pedobacter sp. BS3]
MSRIYLSKRAKDFIDAADDNGNIRNDRASLLYINAIDNACKITGLTTGAVYPFAGSDSNSRAINFLNPAEYSIEWHGTVNHSALGIQSDGSTGYGNTNFIPNNFGDNIYLGVYVTAQNNTQSTIRYIGTSNDASGAGGAYMNGTLSIRTGRANSSQTMSLSTTIRTGYSSIFRVSGTTYYSLNNQIGSTNTAVVKSTYPITILAVNSGSSGIQIMGMDTVGFAMIGYDITVNQNLYFQHLITAAQRAYRGV